MKYHIHFTHQEEPKSKEKEVHSAMHNNDNNDVELA